MQNRHLPSKDPRQGIADSPAGPNTADSVVLISCSSRKATSARPVRELYQGDLFRKARTYAERHRHPWYVLSGKWGLLHPDDIIGPYELALKRQSLDYRRTWASWVITQLEHAVGSLQGRTLEVHAGKDYLQPLREHFDRLGVTVQTPLDGLGIGQQLAWYTHQTADSGDTIREPSRYPAPGFTSRSDAVVAALLDFARSNSGQPEQAAPPSFTPDTAANQLVLDDPFAFLLGVLFDQQIPAERAWRAPYDLRQRLGHLDPQRMAQDPESVRRAIGTPPMLHRFVDKMTTWVVSAARLVCRDYGGDAGRIWNDCPTAREAQRRFDAFPGIGQKKSAMAVEILERDLGVPITDLHGSDIAYDVHVRRVFLRTGLAQIDDLRHMVEVARTAHPERPGQIDFPAWQIGRTWCRAGDTPRCGSCPLTQVCPKDIAAAAKV